MISYPLRLEKFIPKKPWAYVSDFYDEYKEFIDEFDFVVLYAKKGKGKSEVGYRKCEQIIKNFEGNIIYGRLQREEKLTAANELFKWFEIHNLNPQKKRGGGNDYIYFKNLPLLRLVNLSSYQKNRGAVAEGYRIRKNNDEVEILPFDSKEGYVLAPKLIWFDELNSLTFPQNFQASFLLTLDTLGRNHDYKFFGTGNNETAINNPVLNALQLKFDWTYRGGQFCYREISGVKILGIQLGQKCFDEVANPPTKTERLAQFNQTIYTTYFIGEANLNGLQQIINVSEDVEIKKGLLYFCIEDKVLMLCEAKIKDEVNNINNPNAYYFYEIKETFDIIYKNNPLPCYTADVIADNNWPFCQYLDSETLANYIEAWSLQIKDRNLFFDNFDTYGLIKNLLRLSQYYSDVEKEI